MDVKLESVDQAFQPYILIDKEDDKFRIQVGLVST